MNFKSPALRPLLALAAILGVPASLSAQSILLSAGNFALLGGSAISDAGATTISNGNVGLSPATSITGFPPATIVNGSIIATGGVTAQAQTDFTTAATGLAAMSSTENLSNVDLGTVAPLLPGVYTFNATAALTGTLVLNANGQNNAAWVFQIGTSFTSAPGSSVTFEHLGTNGGSDDGVFWDAGAAITIGSDNLFAGNLLAGSSVTIDAGSAEDGRALADDAVSLVNDTVDVLGGPGGGDLTGGLAFNGSGQVVDVGAAIPEPAAVLWLAPLGALGFAFWRRRPSRAQGVETRG
jgi:hypothetical protein